MSKENGIKADLVELGIEEEMINAIIEKVGNVIPQYRYNQRKDEVEKLQLELDARDKQLEDLKPKLVGQDSLLQQISDLQKANDDAKNEYQQQLTETKRTYLLESALKDAKVRNVKAIKGLLELDKVELGEDGLKGLDEQLSALKESDAYLFNIEETVVVEGKPKPSFSSGVTNPPQGGDADPFAKILAKY